jgi:hypothetical protein
MSSRLHPRRTLTAGRYRLDRFGRLYPEKEKRIQAVAIVIVRAKPAPSPKQPAKVNPTPERADRPLRSLARREKPTAVQGFEAIVAMDQHDDVANAVDEFDAKLKAVRARRSKAVSKNPEPAIDGKRVAAVYRAKVRKPAPEPKIPTEHALSREECRSCGIPGWRGCEHQLPYVEIGQ